MWDVKVKILWHINGITGIHSKSYIPQSHGRRSWTIDMKKIKLQWLNSTAHSTWRNIRILTRWEITTDVVLFRPISEHLGISWMNTDNAVRERIRLSTSFVIPRRPDGPARYSRKRVRISLSPSKFRKPLSAHYSRAYHPSRLPPRTKFSMVPSRSRGIADERPTAGLWLAYTVEARDSGSRRRSVLLIVGTKFESSVLIYIYLRLWH
jgi:hypothetical protein